MRNRLILGLSALLLLTGCSSGSLYEKAIADFVQTDKKGVWTDLQFNVIEMGTPTDITVGDSIRILTEAFETQKHERLTSLKSNIEKLVAGRNGERLPTMKNFYQKLIDNTQGTADSLSQTSVSLPETYIGGKPEQVLAKEITCKFSIVPPTFSTRQEITETFVLSADGEKCYRRKRVK